MTSPQRVAVTVLAGYLGAGKTTLVNQLLAEPEGRRLGVLVNDFGAVNIDVDLIAAHDGSTITLENGCVCCSIADGMGQALDAVLATNPDHIVVEASGVAEPAKIAAYGQGWPGCSLAGVVVLADVSDIRRLASDRFVGDLIRSQLAGADAILQTKTDLVDTATGLIVAEWIQTTSFDAPLLDSTATTAELLSIVPTAVSATASSTLVPDANAVFDSLSLHVGVVDRSRLESWLRVAPPSLARVKGVVELPGEGHHLVQRVGTRWSLEATLLATTPLVVIGHKGAVVEDDIRRALC